MSFSIAKAKEQRDKVFVVATPRFATGWVRQDVSDDEGEEEEDEEDD